MRKPTGAVTKTCTTRKSVDPDVGVPSRAVQYKGWPSKSGRRICIVELNRCASPMGSQNPYEPPVSSHGYASVSNRRSSPTLLSLTVTTQFGLLAVAIFLRSRQLSLEDPYNNPYTTWSTLSFLLSIALFGIGIGWSGYRVSHGAAVPVLLWLWLAMSTAFYGWVLFNFLGFMLSIVARG
jgi:hypothetical protein